MFVIQLVSGFQTVGHVDIMLPSDVESHLLVKFPFEADAERYVCARAEIALAYTYRTRADTQEDIRRVGSDAFVEAVRRTETEEIKLRHDIYVHQLVLPFGVQFLAADGVVMSRDALAGHLRLNRPALGELIPEMDAVGLTRIHEDMRRGVTHVVTDTALQTQFAEVRLAVRLTVRRTTQYRQ